MRFIANVKKTEATAAPAADRTGVSRKNDAVFLHHRSASRRRDQCQRFDGFCDRKEIKSLPGWMIVDTPGIRLDDSVAQRAVKREIEKADHTIAVLRGTHFSEELQTILGLIPRIVSMSILS